MFCSEVSFREFVTQFKSHTDWEKPNDPPKPAIPVMNVTIMEAFDFVKRCFTNKPTCPPRSMG